MTVISIQQLFRMNMNELKTYTLQLTSHNYQHFVLLSHLVWHYIRHPIVNFNVPKFAMLDDQSSHKFSVLISILTSTNILLNYLQMFGLFSTMTFYMTTSIIRSKRGWHGWCSSQYIVNAYLSQNVLNDILCTTKMFPWR